MADEHRQYIGPPHFWHGYALNPRERFYYGIGGIYGPFTGPDCMYRKPKCGGGVMACPREFPLETFDGRGMRRHHRYRHHRGGFVKLLFLLVLLVVLVRWLK
jgi:hypothetical protein